MISVASTLIAIVNECIDRVSLSVSPTYLLIGTVHESFLVSTQMSTLRGSKRLQVIQRWLQGIDDPQWEVFPTKKEGKYIVRARKTPQPDDEVDQPIEDEQPPDDLEEPVSEPEPKPKPKPKPSTTRKQPQPQYDPTINLEILNTLKTLGDEIKREREEKAQKRLMKQVLHKEMYSRRTPFNDPYEQEGPKPRKIEYNDDDEYEEEPVQMPPPRPAYPRRRNNIFADVY